MQQVRTHYICIHVVSGGLKPNDLIQIHRLVGWVMIWFTRRTVPIALLLHNGFLVSQMDSTIHGTVIDDGGLNKNTVFYLCFLCVRSGGLASTTHTT